MTDSGNDKVFYIDGTSSSKRNLVTDKYTKPTAAWTTWSADAKTQAWNDWNKDKDGPALTAWKKEKSAYDAWKKSADVV